MRLPENLLDMADAEFFVASPGLIQAGHGKSVNKEIIGKVTEKFPTVVHWFDSLDESAQKDVISYLEHHHGCYLKYRF